MTKCALSGGTQHCALPYYQREEKNHGFEYKLSPQPSGLSTNASCTITQRQSQAVSQVRSHVRSHVKNQIITFKY